MELDGKRRWVLAEDLNLLSQGEEGERLLLLGSHDPYLDLRDRELILPDKTRQRQVWKTVGNPGAVLLGGRVIGFWSVRTRGENLDVSVTLFEPLSPAQRSRLEELVPDERIGAGEEPQPNEVELLIRRIQAIQADLEAEGMSEEEQAFLEAAEDQMAALGAVRGRRRLL